MKVYRVVRLEKVRNPSGSMGIRRKPFGANANTREKAEFIRDVFIQTFGGNYEVQERDMK